MFNGNTPREGNVGQLRIAREVIMTVARQAASEIPGVYALTKIPVDVKNCIQNKRMPSDIAVDISDNVAVIGLAIILEEGYKLSEVVPQVQSAVKESIQSMTGVVISKVNVVVQGMHYSESSTIE